MDKTGEDLNGLHLGKFEERRSTSFFKPLSFFSKMSFTQLENHSQLLCGRDFANKRLFLCQVDV